MSMLDEQEWKNLSDKHAGEDVELETFTDVQWNYITDIGSSVNQLVFDNIAMMGTPCVLAESFLAIPIQFSSSNINIPYTQGMTAIAPKYGNIGLFQGVQYQLATGEVIVNEPINPWYSNSIHPKVEMTPDAKDTIAGEGCLQPDAFPYYSVNNGPSINGSTVRPCFGTNYCPYIGNFGGQNGLYTGVAGSAAINNIATAQNVYSDVLNQPNRLRLGYGISSVASIAAAGTAPTIGGVAQSAIATFNIQVNPLTFTPNATGATGSIKYLYSAPTAATVNANGNPALDATAAGGGLLLSTLNLPASTSN